MISEPKSRLPEDQVDEALEARIAEQVELLRVAVAKKLLPAERPTLEIRRAVSHNDIEIFVNGRLYTTTSDHIAKVETAGWIDKYADMVLGHLRNRRHALTALTYTLSQVQKEIGAALEEVLRKSLPDKDYVEAMIELEDALDDLEPMTEDAAQMCLNKLMAEKLVGSMKQAKRPKGKAQ